MKPKRYIIRVLALAAGLGAAMAAVADERALPFEERQQIRQQMREHWQHMPPPRRGAAPDEARERWRSMPPEERQRLREDLRSQEGHRGGGRHDRRGEFQ